MKVVFSEKFSERLNKEAGFWSSLGNVWDKGQELWERGRAAWELGQQEPKPRWKQRLEQWQSPYLLNPDGSFVYEEFDKGEGRVGRRRVPNPHYVPAIRGIMHPSQTRSKPGKDYGAGRYFMDRRQPSPAAESDSGIMEQISRAAEEANKTGDTSELQNLENQGLLVNKTPQQTQENENRDQQNPGPFQANPADNLYNF